MEIRSPKHIVLFLTLAGSFFFLAGAMWSAYFIASVPMAKDWCTDWIEPDPDDPRGFSGCVEFKNEIEAAKYYHNKRMLDRNRVWVYGTIASGILLGLYLFWFRPRRRHRPVPPDAAVTAAVLGFASAIIVPMVLGWVLPAPYKWFPRFVLEAAQQREREALERITGRPIDPLPPFGSQQPE